jgi:hypothetical protein
MSVATLTKPGSTLVFPAAAVEARLRAALLKWVDSTGAMHGITLPTTTAGKYAAYIHLDSLGVVDLLCDVEPIVGFDLKDSIVRSGGYHSIDQAIGHVLPRIEAAWQRHSTKGVKK